MLLLLLILNNTTNRELKMSQKLLLPIVTLIKAGFESSSGKTPEFKAFARKFKAAMKKTIEESGGTLEKFNTGHFECSGVYSVNGKFGYFSICDVRSQSLGANAIMYRTVTDLTARKSGSNNWGELDNENIGKRMISLIERS